MICSFVQFIEKLFLQKEFIRSFTADFIQLNIRRTNVVYGGLNPGVANVYFTHGSIDPWHPTGILKNFDADSPVDIIPGNRISFD